MSISSVNCMQSNKCPLKCTNCRNQVIKSVHARACTLICAGCLCKVPNIIKESQRILDIQHSEQLTTYICNLASIRWEVTWPWEESSNVFPNRICTGCRNRLLENSYNQKYPLNLDHPTRQHTSATKWVPGECSICDSVYSRGRPRDKKKTAVQGKTIMDLLL